MVTNEKKKKAGAIAAFVASCTNDWDEHLFMAFVCTLFANRRVMKKENVVEQAKTVCAMVKETLQ